MSEYVKKIGKLYYDKVGSETNKSKANERVRIIRESGYGARIEPITEYVIYKSKRKIK